MNMQDEFKQEVAAVVNLCLANIAKYSEVYPSEIIWNDCQEWINCHSSSESLIAAHAKYRREVFPEAKNWDDFILKCLVAEVLSALLFKCSEEIGVDEFFENDDLIKMIRGDQT